MNCLHCQTELTKVANHAIDEFLHSNMQDRFSRFLSFSITRSINKIFENFSKQKFM